jgi:uncharacterized repeat protein (TIGR02543 family)
LTWAADVTGQPTATVGLAAGAFLMGTYDVIVNNNNFNASLSFFYSNGNGAGAVTATGNSLVRTAPPAISPTSVSITGTTTSPPSGNTGFIATGFSSGPTYTTSLQITGYDFSSSTGRYTRNAVAVVAASGSGTITATGSQGQTATASVSVSITTPSQTSYTVTFNGNGSTSGSTTTQVSAVPAALTTNGFAKSGYTFTGWNTQQNGNGTAFAASATYGFVANITLYAQWTASSNSSASANLTLNASTGQLVAGSTVAVVASGLQPTAPYSVVVQSTPQTIGSGNATAGAVNTSVTLPAGLEAGWHTLTFTSTAADGSAVSSVTYFKVSASGTLLATSSTIPAELANTGFDALPYLATGAMLTLAGATILLFARRRFSN